MASDPSVELLMPTYQAESWLDVQLATLFAQDYQDWRLIVRDDGSTDSTREILRFWHQRYQGKILLLDTNDPLNLGTMRNWSALLRASTAPYVMFTNWDDIWYPDKVSRAVATIRELEEQHGRECPIWAQTDVRVVDQNLKEVDPSAWKWQGTAPYRKHSVGRCCLQARGYGATAIANRALVSMAAPVPPGAHTFDWWFSMVATAFGVVDSRRYVSMDWRRHGANRTGGAAGSVGTAVRSVLAGPLRHRRAFYEKFKVGQHMARLLLDRFGEKLAPRDRATLEAVLALPQLGFWSRRMAVLRHRILFTSTLRNLGLLLLM